MNVELSSYSDAIFRATKVKTFSPVTVLAAIEVAAEGLGDQALASLVQVCWRHI